MNAELIKDALSELFLCKRFNVRITSIACERYREAGDQCYKCDQFDQCVIEKKEDAVQVCDVKVCNVCGKEVNHLKRGKCPSCYGKWYREEEKKKKVILDRVLLEDYKENRQMEVKEKEDVQSNGHNDLVVMLDFTDYSDLLEQVKIKAKANFRHPDQQLMAWAQEMCVTKQASP